MDRARTLVVENKECVESPLSSHLDDVTFEGRSPWQASCSSRIGRHAGI